MSDKSQGTLTNGWFQRHVTEELEKISTSVRDINNKIELIKDDVNKLQLDANIKIAKLEGRVKFVGILTTFLATLAPVTTYLIIQFVN